MPSLDVEGIITRDKSSGVVRELLDEMIEMRRWWSRCLLYTASQCSNTFRNRSELNCVASRPHSAERQLHKLFDSHGLPCCLSLQSGHASRPYCVPWHLVNLCDRRQRTLFGDQANRDLYLDDGDITHIHQGLFWSTLVIW